MATKNVEEAWERINVAREIEMGEPHRILMADHDAEVLRRGTEALINVGYCVDFAADGVAAWNAIRLGKYDLLVTENCLPKTSGLELLKNIHIARIELPVIMVTGEPPEEKLRPPPWLQIEAMLFKPYTAEVLLAMVKNVLLANDLAPDQTGLQSDWQNQRPADDLRL